MTPFTMLVVALEIVSVKAGSCGSSSGSEKKKNIHTTDIIIENNLPCAIFDTNATIRPIKLMIDTGSTMTIVASDVLKKGVINTRDRTSYGGLGTSTGINTLGVAWVALPFTGEVNVTIDARMNLVDRKFTHEWDGILGADVMLHYRLVLDIPTQKLIYNTKNNSNLLNALCK
ncbi:uncharacterized protein LOC116342278 [Contarinia nasturtii]|uniref:uncharacterized protein LOC116342278 n=1 Tax=Contarinia nasturtii TaxID=265458 RepID=UPI0012D3F56E|nr:uncharacterized protein LOC116342278 [Contarinia nasturtii]